MSPPLFVLGAYIQLTIIFVIKNNEAIKRRSWATHHFEHRVAANSAAICHPSHRRARYCSPLQAAEVS